MASHGSLARPSSALLARGATQRAPCSVHGRLRSEDALGGSKGGGGSEARRAALPAASLRPVAYAPSPGDAKDSSRPSSSQGTGGGRPPALLPASSTRRSDAAAGAAAAASRQPGLLAPVQEQGGASLLQLVAAWDQLAARLPPQAGAGRGADVILDALKLAVAHAPAQHPAAAAAAGTSAAQQQPQVARPVARALSLASRLADLAASGLPIDAESIAAGILAEVLLAGSHSPGAWHPSAAAHGGSGGSGPPLTLQLIEERVGPIVAQLVHDVQRARQLPARVELLDDTAASALRELCLSFYDVRATAVEIVSRLDLLCSPGQPSYEQQVSALEALQMYAPMGHALGLGAVAQQLEDRCFQILFPESYVRTAAWLREEAAAHAGTLERCQAALRDGVLRDPRFAELAGGLVVHGRTKTLFSTLKKLLRLGNTAAGGRARTQLYDLMGLRAIVQPRTDLPQEEAEALAAQACYLVRDAACALWECLPDRAKDYVAVPKSNGYQSLHSTILVRFDSVSLDAAGGGDDGGYAVGDQGDHSVRGVATVELQIRTQDMHDCAERGKAAHGAYKGGLDSSQALQLKSVTEAVLQRAAAAAAAAVPAPAPAAGSLGQALSADAAAESLFRHLDQNGDGRISLEELQFALQELGVQGEQAQSRAAAELLQLAAADAGGGADNDGADGTIGFEAFMAFQRRVGLLQAFSAVDHQQAHVLEERHAVAAGAAEARLGGSMGSMDEGSLFSEPLGAAALPWGSGSFDAGDAPGSAGRLAAGAALCRARGAAGGGALRWQAPGQLGCQWRGSVAARASPFGAATATSSSSGSVDTDGDVAEPTTAGPSRVDATALNSAVPLHVGTSSHSSSSSNGSSSSSANGTSHGSTSSGSASRSLQAAAAEGAAEQEAPLLAKPARRAVPTPVPTSEGADPEAEGLQEADASRRHEAAAAWRASRTVQGIVRLMSGDGPPPADATWQLVPAPCNPHRVLNAAGEPVAATAAAVAGGGGEQRVQVLRVPEQGPCIVGAVLDRDCDYIMDVPTISGRHVRLELLRRPDAKGGYSRLMLTDLGSTNGTFVNRRLVEANKDVPLRPGDIISLAGPDIAFEVQALPPPPPPPAGAASNGAAASAAAAAGAELAPAPASASAALESDQQAAATLPAVVAALRLAAALEAAAAAQGLFPPGGALHGDVSQRARRLMAEGCHDQAYMLLLAGAMQQPWAGALWAQLANLERQRARRRRRGSASAARSPSGGSFGVSRAFFAAAAACFAALTPALAGGAWRVAVERAEGLVRVLASWAQLELSMDNTSAGRTLFRRGATAAREHPAGAAAAGVARLLVTWATRESRGGEAAEAQRLCVEALDADPGNAYALTLLGSMEAAAGQVEVARELFSQAVDADRRHTAALQAWGRLEASSGSMRRARTLFQKALDLEPSNTFVLQAWGVAEARRGSAGQARTLLQSATEVDPACRAAWHAWGKLEADAGNTQAARTLYGRVLELAPGSVPTLSALGCLERRAGDLAAAENHLGAALQADPGHVPSVSELALVREAQGRIGEAAVLQRRAARLSDGQARVLSEVAAARLPAAGKR